MGSGASTPVDDVPTLLLCHSTQEQTLRHLLASHQSPLDVLVVTEIYPTDLQVRAEVLTSCGCAIVGVDPLFQTSTVLIDALSFLKDTRKKIVAGPLTFFTRPSGAVGAICMAFGRWDPRLFEDTSAQQLAMSHCRLLTQSELKEVLDRDALALEESPPPEPSHDPQIMFVYADEDGHRVAQLFDGLESQGLSFAGTSILSTQDEATDIQTLAQCRVVSFVITDKSVASSSFRRLFEAALRWKKPILPISAGVRLTGWLQLAMAGRLWYQVDLEHLDYLHLPYAQVPSCPCRVEDACLATDFLMCANGLLTATAQPGVLDATLIKSRETAALQAARERAMVLGLDAQRIVELCGQVEEAVGDSAGPHIASLEALGVATTTEAIEAQRESDALAYPPVCELLPEQPTAELANIHYQVTRMGFKPLPSVLDANGLPIRNLQLDAMFSYQWGSQETVLDVHHQGSVSNVRAWFDVFGHMQGNVNSAMAAAVENVACVVVFLTPKYLESINCQLEFQYAARRRKPFIMVFLTDPALMTLPPWMTDVVGAEFSVYPTHIKHDEDAIHDRVLALDYSAERVNGVPLLDVLFGAIRVLAAKRSRAPLSIAYDGSLRLYATTGALRHVLSTPSDTGGHDNGGDASPSASAKTCTRCGAGYHPSVPSSLEGCRKHSAYFMGGTLLAGRWVCCRETKADGVGCQPATHMDAPRAWTCDPDYGTFTWKPE